MSIASGKESSSSSQKWNLYVMRTEESPESIWEEFNYEKQKRVKLGKIDFELAKALGEHPCELWYYGNGCELPPNRLCLAKSCTVCGWIV
jgi:hypothetical protein